jgi:hypothetical protein
MGLFFCFLSQYQEQTGIDNVKCKTCDPNTYQADNRSAAVNHDNKAEDCLKCPDNMYSEAGKQGCTPCAAGKAADDTTTLTGICVDCIAGQVSSSATKLICEKCTVGYYQDVKGLPSCNKCIPGQYQDEKGKTECKDCPKGRHDAGNVLSKTDLSTTCKECATGLYQKEKGSTFCLPCLTGTYQNDLGKSSCKECPKGYSNGETEKPKCTECIAGSFQDETRKPNCKDCVAGLFSEEVGATILDSCIACPAGFFSKTPNSQKCTQCGTGKKGESSAPGSTTCSFCDQGRYQPIDTPGICQDCQPGQYADGKGQKSCTKCSIDTFSSEPGKSSKADCLQCSIDRSTGTSQGNTAKSACLCKRTDYYTDDSTEGACVSCPVGADCSANDGLTLAELTAKPGYWRPSLDNDIFSPCAAGYSALNAQDLANARCCSVVNDAKQTNISICVRNTTTTTTFSHTDEQCSDGYSGSLCLVCAAGFVKQGTDCISCPEGASIVIAAIPLLSMLVVLFVVLLIFFVCGKKATSNAKRANKWFGQAKIMLSFLQIFSSIPGVLDGVPWPKPFLEFALPLGLANLDFLSVLAKTGCSLNVRFYDKFILHMILPVGCLIIILVAYFVAVTCCVKKDDSVRHSSVKETASKAVILVVLLLYPGLST